MRPVQIGDLLALAGAVSEQAGGPALALRLCCEAHAAHLYVKRFRRLHPLWGNGSVMSRALAEGGAMQADWSQSGLVALRIACDSLRIWRERLDCHAPRLCASLGAKHGESEDGRNPAETEQP